MTHVDHDAVGGRLLMSTWLPGLASFINSLTAGCAYTMDDYTNACGFKEYKACYGRSERRDFGAILSPSSQKKKQLILHKYK